MKDPSASKRTKAFRWLMWSALALIAAALFYVLVVDPTILIIAPFAIGCMLEFLNGRGCAP